MGPWALTMGPTPNADPASKQARTVPGALPRRRCRGAVGDAHGCCSHHCIHNVHMAIGKWDTETGGAVLSRGQVGSLRLQEPVP